MSVLDRLPSWATTGVGSLPFTEVDEAAAHAAHAYGLPFCPQLPRLEGDMIAEWLGGDPARCGWSAERDRERPLAWDAWLAELKRRPPRHWMVKLQVTGPLTLACALERSAGQRASRKEAIALARELARWLAANAAAQVRELGALGFATLLVVDEPALEVFGSEGVERVWDALRVPASVWGLHFCCHVPWRVVERAEPDLLSFDLALDPVESEAADTLRRLAAAGTWIAWGALRVEPADDSGIGLDRLTAAIERLGTSPDRSLLTPNCGTGRASVDRERRLVAEVGELAERCGSPTPVKRGS
jgi:hypothetical protein